MSHSMRENLTPYHAIHSETLLCHEQYTKTSDTLLYHEEYTKTSDTQLHHTLCASEFLTPCCR